MSSVTTYEGHEIQVNSEGWFFTIENGLEIRARTLPSLKKKLAAIADALDALRFDHYSSSGGRIGTPERLNVVPESSSGRFRDADTGKLIDDGKFFYYDREILSELHAIIKENRVLIERFNKTLGRLKPINTGK